MAVYKSLNTGKKKGSYMVITQVGKGKYAGHWEPNKARAIKWGSNLIKKGRIKRYIVTKKPKRHYCFKG